MINNKKNKPSETAEDLLKDILIAQLASMGAPQMKIREIVGVDIYRISRIVKHLSVKPYGK